MFTTVRYFIKTSIAFLMLGLLSGLHMLYAMKITKSGFVPGMITAHTHMLLVGFVLMMIMGVALWFFPRAEKEDKRYNPALIWITYFLMSAGTLLRFSFEILNSYLVIQFFDIIITISGTFQVLAVILFFYSMWGRIRSVGSHIREAKGERF
jgi:heme/copper-type cytochrome/quinol oxidase subunit 1